MAMSMDEWDQEIELVAREIGTVRVAHEKSKPAGNRSLIARKISIIQAQINLERTIERMRKIVSREYLLLPREKAMLHWGQIYIEKLTHRFAAQTKLMTRNLWLKLVATRLNGEGAEPTTEVDADELMSLAIRQQNLQKAELVLADKLVKLRQEKKALIQRYECLGIAEANRYAAGSLFGRLGANSSDALDSPTMKALALYFKQLTSLVREDQDPDLKKTERTFGKKAARLITESSDMVIKAVQEQVNKPEPPHKAKVIVPPQGHVLNEYRLAMLELAELEAESKEAYESFLNHRQEPPKPVMVAKKRPLKTTVYETAVHAAEKSG